MPWYVLRVKPQRELATEKQVRALGFDAMCPYADGSRRVRQLVRRWRYPLFTGYVFAALEAPALDWQRICESCNSEDSRVVGRLLGGDDPVALRPSDVEYIKSIADGKYKPGDVVGSLVVGDTVLVPDGLLHGFPATIVRIKRGRTATLEVKTEKNSVILKRPLAKLVKT
jgi:transcription antitermination factor NusG